MDIIIRETQSIDLPNVLALWNDGEVMQYVGFPNGLGKTMPQMEAWLDRVNQIPMCRHYSIYQNDGRYCGETFYRVDRVHDLAAVDIKLFPAARGRGIAAEALSFSIALVFANKLSSRVYVDPHPDNKKAWALYEKLGFVPKPRPEHLEPFETYLELTADRWRALSSAEEKQLGSAAHRKQMQKVIGDLGSGR